MSASSVEGWEARHGRHRSAHRPRDGRSGVDPEGSAVPTTRTEPVEESRTWHQRASDAFPMAMVAGVCFALGLSLRAGGTSGPAPAFPIWTLFLALGCIAMLGAGASWVVGDSAPSLPPSAAAPRAVRGSTRTMAIAPSRLARRAAPLGDDEDDTLPEVNWEPEEPIMPKKATRRVSMAPPTEDPLADLADPGTVADATNRQVIEEIDRLLTDLKPAPTRGRPAV